MKKIVIAIILVGIFSVFSIAQEKKNQISIMSGIYSINQSGCASCDYEPGANDFPITPSHKNTSIAFSYARFIAGDVGVELDLRYHFGTEVLLTDPSDQESVAVETFDNYSVTGNLIYTFSGGPMKPYLTVGAGINVLSPYEREFTSDRGSIIIITAPEKTNNMVFNFGGGIIAGGPVALRVDIRYAAIRNLDVKGIQLLAGVAFKF